ncbi:MAG: acyltransferase [Pedobacter sp.]|nr:MAG: acyltransferase [Pedobacter sp.]
MTIGNHCEINEDVYIQSATIGNYVLIAQNVSILAVTHHFKDRDMPIIEQGFSEVMPVIIEDDVWIGRNVTIMPGVTLGKGCVIGTGAVVTKNVLPYNVMGGVPARIISERGKKTITS